MKKTDHRLATLMLALLCAVSAFASNAFAGTNYKILSSTESEMIIEVRPEYRFDTIHTANGDLIKVQFPDARFDGEIGAPMLPRLPLGFLLPSKTPLNVEIIEQVISGTRQIALAPYPTTIRTKDGVQARYECNANAVVPISEIVSKDQVTTIRTAYAQHVQIAPVRYDAASRSVRLVESLKLRVKFYGKPTAVNAAPLTLAERELFSTGYVNGDNASFYRSAQAETMKMAKQELGTKAMKAAPQAAGEWLTIETDREGVYKVTVDDLRGAGITSFDPNTIELFGYGARIMPEAITDSSGEWRPVAIDVRTDGSGQLTEILFYAPGAQYWKYQRRADKLFGLYHIINPYMSVGKFMLKVGGSNVAPLARVSFQPDTITESPVPASNVSVMAVREVERAFEMLNLSRELVGEMLPREGIDPLTVDVSLLPGFVPDSTILRVGTGGIIRKPNTYNVWVNGQKAGTINGQVNPSLDSEDPPKPRRNWRTTFELDKSIGKPERVGINYSTTDPDGRAFLNWIEIFYRANTSIGNTSLPFYVLDTKEAFEYNFTNANGGAVWDVTDPSSPRLISSAASGGSLPVSIQGQADILRQFIAFGDQSVLRVGSGKISRTSPFTLRETLGQQGTTNIIITPEAFRAQAEDLKSLREKGGLATESVKSTVVLLEDIYKEFGYGAKDPVAIRDFMAYTYRHTMRNGTQVPMFLTLFGGGHVDYQNRVTELPTRIPVYELPSTEHLESLRSISDINTPDDGYYVRLTPKTGLSTMDHDVGVGRLSLQSTEDAEVVVAKLRRYETVAAEGPWRARVSMVIDDRQGAGVGPDALDHLADVEATVPHIPTRMQVNKVYGMNYQTIYTSGGRRKPEMETAILDVFNGGSIITGYIGHGNPKVWTHESVLQVPSTINKLNNYDKLTFVAMATCDFGEYDNYAEVSGGVMMLLREAGGAIGMLGTSRSVYPGEALYPTFFQGLFDVPCESSFGSNHLGTALLISKLNRTGANPIWFYLQGDPAMRLLVPKQYAIVDSINNNAVSDDVSTIPALSEVRISGRISNTCEEIAGIDPTFNGKATVTLFDTKTTVSRTTTFVSSRPITDVFQMEGPILYRGTATIRNGRFTANFIVPRDIKFDSNSAKISVIAYADDSRSALGAYDRVRLAGSDPSVIIDDTSGPDLKVYIGTRAFRSGDVVPMNSNVIVDIKDELGLNTSTASVGHSFIGWVDDESDKSVDMAENYVSEQDNFRVGTAITKMSLPAGRHTLRVRAFDALNNPSFAEVEFVAKDDDPFKLYNATVYPNPVKDHMTVSFMHPLNSGSLVEATLDIFTSDGRLVRTLQSRNVSGNIIEMSWDVNDDAGLIAPQGAYTYRITVTDQNDGRSASAFGTFVIVR